MKRQLGKLWDSELALVALLVAAGVVAGYLLGQLR